MVKCSECGEESMSFKCKYCGKKFCSEHRLPENHDCDKLEEGIEEERQESKKWFKEKKVRKTPEKNEIRPRKVHRDSFVRDALTTLTSSATLAIILVTVFVYFLQGSAVVTDVLMLEPEISTLLEKPWSIITVMLVHGGALHIFANMITFYFFGTPLERLIGAKKLLKFYIGAGVIASLGYVAFRNLLFLLHGETFATGAQVLGPAVGASGAVVAVFAAVAVLYPRAEVLLFFVIPMRISTAVYALAAIETFNLMFKAGGITLPIIGLLASSAHLTGLVVGLWYGRRLREKHNPDRRVLDLLGY